MNHVTDERTDEPLGRPLHDWIESSLDELSDGTELPPAVRSDVLSRLPGTPQRRRWWPFSWHPFGFGATRSADPTGPHPEGRTQSMFNATRVAVAVAVLALVGGLAYVAAPADQQSVPPGTETTPIDPADFAGFTGAFRVGSGRQGEAIEQDWGTSIRGEYYPRGTIEVSDDRLSGSHRSIHNYDHFRGGAKYGVRTTDLEITNDLGTWTGQGIGLQVPHDSTMHYEFRLAGSGAYEGLSALLTLSQDEFGFSFDADGVIFPGELPPYPELPPAE